MKGNRVSMLLKQTLKHQDSKQHDAGTEMRMWAGLGLAISGYGKKEAPNVPKRSN